MEDLLRAHVRGQPGVDLRLGHAVTGLAQRDDSVTVAVRDGNGSRYQITARYLIGCDGAAGVVREQIGACYGGHADPRPNFNVVFRAPALDTHLGPAVQYWVLGAAVPGCSAGWTCTGPGGPSCPASTPDTVRRTPRN